LNTTGGLKKTLVQEVNMFTHKTVYSFLVALGLLSVLILSGCGPADKADGAPLPPRSDAGEPSEGSLYLDEIDLIILESFPVQVRAQLRGQLADGCTDIESIKVVKDEDAKVFTVHFHTYRDPELMCTQALVPFEETVDLDVRGLPAGTYTVRAEGETATFTLQTDNEIPTD
jgi:inhibitor of cysteine peptidase